MLIRGCRSFLRRFLRRLLRQFTFHRRVPRRFAQRFPRHSVLESRSYPSSSRQPRREVVGFVLPGFAQGDAFEFAERHFHICPLCNNPPRTGDSRSALASGSCRGPLFLCSRKHLRTPSSSAAIDLHQLAFDHINSTIGLIRFEHGHAHRPGHQIGQLQSRRVGLLVGKHHFKGKCLLVEVASIANAAKFQLKFIIFVTAALLYYQMNFGITDGRRLPLALRV